MNNKITYDQLTNFIADELDLSSRFTRKFIDEFVEAIREGLVTDGKVNVSKLGIFELKKVDAREGRDPKTGDPITIPAHEKVVFKPYKKVRERINAPYREMEAEFVDPPSSSQNDGESSEAVETAPSTKGDQTADASAEKISSDTLPINLPALFLDWAKRNRHRILGIAGLSTTLIVIGYGTYKLLKRLK